MALLEMEKYYIWKKSTLDETKNRLYFAEEKINQLDDTAIKTIKNEEHREKSLKIVTQHQ